MQLPEVGLQRGSFPGCLWHSLNINSQSYLQAAALFSECGLEQPRQDGVWPWALQAYRVSCQSHHSAGFAHCWPQLCTGQCSLRLTGCSGGEEIKDFPNMCSSPSHRAHSPSESQHAPACPATEQSAAA